MARTLRGVGIDVFLDVDSLRAGDDWQDRLRREIERTDQVRVGWSRYAAQSDWVRREYTEALRVQQEQDRSNFLLIDLLDGTPLAPELERIQAERSAFSSPETDRLLRDPYREIPQGQVQPSVLLRSEYRVVPFHGRKEILERTEGWCQSGKLFDAVLYVGPGGSGKTRLFAEVCARLRGQGWETGFLESVRTQEALRVAPDRLDKLLHPRLPRLVVVDYAESRRAEVEAILQRAVAKREGQPVRLVLLARTAGDWWRELLQSSADFGPLLSGSTKPNALPPLTPTLEEREAAFQSAVAAFAGVLGTAAPAGVELDLEPQHFGQALFLHLTALLTVLGDEGASPAELLARLLDHEERYWKQVARDLKLDERGLERTLAPSVALVTLVGGVSTGAELNNLLSRTPLLADRGMLEYESVGEVLQRLYGWEGRIEPLQPDRVGESLVARELARDGALRLTWVEGASPAQLRQGLTVLGRVAMDRVEAGEWLVEMLTTHTRILVRPAIEVAVEGGEPVARALTDAIERNPDPELSRELEDTLPHQTIALRNLALVITSQAVTFARRDSDRARSLIHLGIRLSDLGRRQEALATAQESVQIYRRLADADPDSFLPELGRSLSNLGNRLSNVGHWKEALAAARESVQIRRHLADADPDSFLLELAKGLSNLGNRLIDVGSKEEALAPIEEAAEIYRRLAEADPNAYLPDLSRILNNLGGILQELGHSEEGLASLKEAVEIRRRLTETRPDAFLPDLAISLQNLGTLLSELGRHEEALAATHEAVQMHRWLVDIHPNAFLPALALSLLAFGARLGELGRWTEARNAEEESVELHRRLATAYPDRFLPDLAQILRNLSVTLHALGEDNEALAARQEASEILERLNRERR